MIIEWEGKQFRVKRYDVPKEGDLYISPNMGGVRRRVGKAPDVRLIVEEVKEQYKLGGVVFEETGEFRSPRAGDWIRSPATREPFYVGHDNMDFDAEILRPVRLEE